MNYQQSLDFLNSFIDWERLLHQTHERNWNLRRIQVLLRALKHPEKQFFPILIAGTKGKGSTGAFLESILKTAGISVGFYSSPHLESPRERIRIHGKNFSKKKWAQGLTRLRRIIQHKNLFKKEEAPTYFEILTALAIDSFTERKVQIGIFEVGLGGRLDATNVLKAPLVLLTSIDKDHERFLGVTLSQISREKAAVIKRGAKVITGKQYPEVMREIHKRIRRQNAVMFKSNQVSDGQLLGLSGDYQRVNAGIAVKAAEVLRQSFSFPVARQHIEEGLQKVVLPGRMEEIKKGRNVWLLDVAHNPASAKVFVKAVKKQYPKKSRTLIFAVSKDKQIKGMLKPLSSCFDSILLPSVGHPRVRLPQEVTIEAAPFFKRIYPVRNSKEAILYANHLVPKGALVAVTGSFYLTGEIRSELRK